MNSQCPAKTKKLILEDYLIGKIANLMGIAIDDVNDLLPIRIESPYSNSEGVIKRYENSPGFVKGLRIDLQKEQTGYACFQVQYGTGGSNSKKGGAYAGVLMKVDTDFTFNDLKTSLTCSFNYQPVKYARLDP